MWDQFVFPRFAFAPKAPIISQMIAAMQLRPANVLFIDDNVRNLEEARHLLPELNVADSSQPACEALLDDLLEDNRHVAKNRIEEYRMLERRVWCAVNPGRWPITAGWSLSRTPISHTNILR